MSIAQKLRKEHPAMLSRLVPLLWSLCLLMPLSLAADGGDSTDNPWNQQVNPQQVTADYDAGYRQLKAGQCREAIRSFKRVIQANKQHAMAYTNMAYCYRQLNNYKRAIKLYNRALAIEPNLAEAHEYLGGALLALGKVDEAKKHLAILEKLDPKLAAELRADIDRHERS
jgi:tetratricopeptide (TPR) repeat protein